MCSNVAPNNQFLGEIALLTILVGTYEAGSWKDKWRDLRV